MSNLEHEEQPDIVRGILAGVAGGLAAAWVMNCHRLRTRTGPDTATRGSRSRS